MNNNNFKEVEEYSEKRKEEIRKMWSEEEWEEMRKKLELLSLEELRELTTRVGIQFTIGNENIQNKQEFILVLDEADKDELIKIYEDIISKRNKSN